MDTTTEAETKTAEKGKLFSASTVLRGGSSFVYTVGCLLA